MVLMWPLGATILKVRVIRKFGLRRIAGQMAKIAALAGLLVLMTNIVARADPSYAVWADQSYIVWRLAHERLLAKWRASEPRCGWTAGGYACSSRKRSGYAPIWIRG